MTDSSAWGSPQPGHQPGVPLPPGRPPGAPRPGAAAPGWYPDPAGTPAERWWDGAAWDTRTRPVSLLAQPLTRQVVRNTPATVGLGLGALSLLVNTLLVVSLGALVVCVLGLARAGQLGTAGFAPVGRGRAVAGLVLAAVGAAATVLLKGLVF
ncbi:DUF2510 domain-containing protein [uncultured Cellulomonas sp.]|uniref:DUF2510 domain-containing protein n=1 Tax=uncultured Cellulomonas sp. TaxID=189682 RepID=UPI0026084334|nr:DUF2510 domain-containing protein [uncultured Cellulomonas sp.]